MEPRKNLQWNSETLFFFHLVTWNALKLFVAKNEGNIMKIRESLSVKNDFIFKMMSPFIIFVVLV